MSSSSNSAWHSHPVFRGGAELRSEDLPEVLLVRTCGQQHRKNRASDLQEHEDF